jgi:RNA polymerase sigma factor (sigma-70 family)
MMKTEVMPVPHQNDVDLVVKSLEGSQDAFQQIVERYQTLICSLAYCATGSLNQSEDLAQETFVTAWKELPKLREPSKLRSWLCGILRFLVGKQLRRQGHEPAHAAEPMEAAHESHSPEPQPPEQAISNEELAILWRSLEKIPEIYREPLVLFYREHQSIENVAQNLELSEDAVKQRLSRGRKLLHEEVLAFVEGALKKTGPGKTFTLGVLAALSLTTNSARAATIGVTVAKSAKAATTGVTAAKAGVGAATKTGATLGAAGGFIPVLSSYYFLFKSNLEDAKSPREREFMVWFFWIQAASLLILVALLGVLFFGQPRVYDKKVIWTVFFFAPLVLVFALGKYARHHRRQIQIEDGTWVEPMTHEERKEHFNKLRRHGSRGRMYLYLGLACNMGGLTIIQLVRAWNGDRNHLLFLGFLSGFTLYLAICAWRSRPR